MLDIKISGGTVVDGLNSKPYSADIGIKGSRIVDINSTLPSAIQTIEADTEIITPGFIDTHSHSDLRILANDPPRAKVRQGITTELLGQDGLGVAPVTDSTEQDLFNLTAGLLGPLPSGYRSWSSFQEYLETLSNTALINNQAVLISHGPIRLISMGASNRDAEPEELDKMKTLVDQAMQDGAFGFSTGLIYPPASYARTDELIALNEVVAEYDGVFVVHMRDEGHYLLDSLQEVIKIARESGVRLHISHLQAHGKANWHLMPRALKVIDEALQEGIQITADRYPYTAGSTVLSAVLPSWVLDGGPRACLNRLKDQASRDKIHEDFTKDLDVWHNRAISTGWDNIVISWVGSDTNSHLEGSSIAKIADSLDKHPVDVVCDLLLEEELQVSMISHYGSEENLERILSHPSTVLATDGIYGGRPHPRLYGTYPRFFSKYVKERKLMDLHKAVHKTATKPCEILNLTDRGTIDCDKIADLVIFDPDSIKDRATYNDPQKSPEGIQAVLVNGKPAWTNTAKIAGTTENAGTLLQPRGNN